MVNYSFAFDSTERIKSILFIALSSLLVLLEVVKWIWDGKVSIVKSKSGKIFLLLFFSPLLVTTLFARILGFLCGVMMEEWVQVSL